MSKKMLRQEFIAKIRHIGWFCFQIAAKQPYNVEMNKDQLKSMLNAVEYALANPNMTPEQNHDNWMEMKQKQGWVYGLKKDFKLKTHPDMVPYNELPEIEKLKDLMDRIANKEGLKLWNLFNGLKDYE